jgi:hypothetical protein
LFAAKATSTKNLRGRRALDEVAGAGAGAAAGPMYDAVGKRSTSRETEPRGERQGGRQGLKISDCALELKP